MSFPAVLTRKKFSAKHCSLVWVVSVPAHLFRNEISHQGLYLPSYLQRVPYIFLSPCLLLIRMGMMQLQQEQVMILETLTVAQQDLVVMPLAHSQVELVVHRFLLFR